MGKAGVVNCNNDPKGISSNQRNEAWLTEVLPPNWAAVVPAIDLSRDTLWSLPQDFFHIKFQDVLRFWYPKMEEYEHMRKWKVLKKLL